MVGEGCSELCAVHRPCHMQVHDDKGQRYWQQGSVCDHCTWFVVILRILICMACVNIEQGVHQYS